MFTSILDKNEVISKDCVKADYYIDFNLNRIIDKICYFWGDDVSAFYNYFPNDAESEQYRSDVYKDLSRENVYEAFSSAYSKMCERKRAAVSGQAVNQSLSRQVWHIKEVGLYSQALSELYESIKDIPFAYEGMTNWVRDLGEYVTGPKFNRFSDASVKLKEQLDAVRMTLTYEDGKVAVSSKTVESGCESRLRALYPNNVLSLQSPFLDTPSLVGLEMNIVNVYVRKNPGLFKEIASFCSENNEYLEPWIERFFEEIPFYLSFMKFERHMRELGAHFTVSTSQKASPFEAKGLYDLALFISNNAKGKEVVDNDMYYGEDERFFVLTGPNQGGKTTFARSLGQLVFFAKLGLPVPARSANVPYFSQILSHFSVEESVETGRGKLMEELVRLAPMMGIAGEDTFIVINELFTTAANYDACIMGKRVLRHFIGKGCKGIYVTHLSELLDGTDKATGLCAQFDENMVQTFKIERRVMEYTNTATNQILKYNLTYDGIRERLKLLR